MNVLVIGRGGREHSIVMKLSESKQIDHLYVAPGNGGMGDLATIVDIDEMDIDSLVNFAKEKAVDLTIVGPENPLNAGIADEFQEANLPIFAPTKKAALLEGSKDFAKEFMMKYDIPTAAYQTFTDVEKAKAYIQEKGAPIVIKADGLAAGKGVVVATTKTEALQAVQDMMIDKAFQDAGAKVVIEECLTGEEFSLMAFVHGENVYPMVPARDHKRAYDGDLGPNTGGMGAFAPVPDVSGETLVYSYHHILKQTATGMVKEGRPFTGILYAGLMMTEDGPKVIEFNARFGDPETQVVLPLLENDLLDVFLSVLHDRQVNLVWRDGYSLGVVLASNGYPAAYEKGVAIPQIPTSQKTFITHAGTKVNDGGLQSNGGRVLLVGGIESTLKKAQTAVYDVLEKTGNVDGFFYRKDIGKF